MNVYMTEDEQVEQLKKMWSKYGNTILTMILLIILSVQGYRWYQDKALTNKASASSAFNGLMDSVAKKNNKSILAKANFIKDNYRSTVYATSAALMLANQDIEKNKYKEAEQELKWILTNSKSKSFKQLANLRLSRIFLYQKKYKLALSSLSNIEDELFVPLISEAKGDVYLAQGNKSLAKDAYQLALSQLPNSALESKELKLKLSQVSEQRSQLVDKDIQSKNQSS